MKLRNKKTGEVVEADYISVARSGFDVADKDGNIIAKDIHTLPLCYLSVRELTSEFEDYTPSKPLIKDEKVRKAVKAWAEATGTTSIDYWCDAIASRQNDSSIEFDEHLFKNGDNYTITELCGGEEE